MNFLIHKIYLLAEKAKRIAFAYNLSSKSGGLELSGKILNSETNRPKF